MELYIINKIKMTTTISITKYQLAQILKDIRENTGRGKNLDQMDKYKRGEDVSSIKDIYLKTIPVSGAKVKTIEKTCLVVIKYYTENQELCSASIAFKRVHKHAPQIINIPIPK